MTALIQDEARCLTSWRARPQSFITLMAVYESNFVNLRNLLGDAHRLPDHMVSSGADDAPLHVSMLERGPYTTTLTLTYRFEGASGTLADPDMQVRVYRDAGLAEALSCARWRRHPVFASWQAPHSRDMASDMQARWRRNMMLNKWLDYCLERGHRFAAP